MPQPQSHHERRRTPRIDVAGNVRARLEPSAQEVIVRDLSLGGFLIESPSAFPVDAVHHFRIALENDQWVTVTPGQERRIAIRQLRAGHDSTLPIS